MNTTTFRPLLREGLLTPFVLVRVGYDERAFTSTVLTSSAQLNANTFNLTAAGHSWQ